MPLALPLLFACVPHLTSPPDTGTEDTAWVAPENTWPTSAPPSDLEATGTGDGQIPPDFRMMDQFGDTVALWQFYGMVIVIDFSTMWCAPCDALAYGVEEVWQAYRDQGFVYLTVLPQDVDGDVPDVDDLTLWAERHGITAPILADAEDYTTPITGNDGFPRLMVIGRDMRIVEDEVVPASDEAVRALVESAL